MSNSELERIEALEQQLQATLGHLKAMEYGVRLLIATHPHPEVLSAALEGIEHRATPSDVSDAMYEAALAQGIAALRDQVVASAPSLQGTSGRKPTRPGRH